MSSITEFYREECEKIDPSDINAYFNLHLKDNDKGILQLETSWNDTETDLGEAVHARETNTHLFLSPVENPVALQYNRERGEPDCINGEDLARIIPMTKLKDVNQNIQIKPGDGYIFDGYEFNPYPIKPKFEDIYNKISNIEGDIAEIKVELHDHTNRINNLEVDVADLKKKVNELQEAITFLLQITGEMNKRIEALEELTARPDGVPTDTRICYGNINLYSDYTNADNRNSGLYTHDIKQNKTNDEYFA